MESSNKTSKFEETTLEEEPIHTTLLQEPLLNKTREDAVVNAGLMGNKRAGIETKLYNLSKQ